MHLISHNILRSGIPIVQVVAGPRVSSSTDDGYALALTDNGDVYSWGKGYKGEIDYTRDCALAYVILVTLLHDLVLGMATVHMYKEREDYSKPVQYCNFLFQVDLVILLLITYVPQSWWKHLLEERLKW